MKTIGIIGGFGPEATAQFYLKLVAASRRVNRGTQPNIIVQNVAVPRDMEHKLLINGRNLDGFIPLLIRAAKNLECAGADMIVLPCNTLHVHEQVLQSSICIPFISIIRSTTKFLRRQNISRIGLLGSRVTVRENLFNKQTKEVTFINVPTNMQRHIDRGLNTFVRTQNSTQLGGVLKKSFRFFKDNNVQDVLLACTDFGSLCPDIRGIRIHDTVDILVHATVNML